MNGPSLAATEKAPKPLRIAVTGGSGQIGRHVVRALVERGHAVINLDRKQSEDRLARFACVDLAERTQVQPWLEQVDAVAHLGEIPNAISPFSPEVTFAHNLRVASAILQAAADIRLPRVVYTSSCQVYGCWSRPAVAPLHLPMDETHPLQPQNIYSLAKAAAESYARFAARDHGLSVAIFRLPWVIVHEWGEADWQRFERPMGPISEFGTFVHSSDAARAYALALEKPLPGCEAYHLTSAQVMSNRPLNERLRRDHPDYPRLPDDWPPYKSPLLLDKAKRDLGWEPKWNIVDLYRRRGGRAEG